MDATKQAKHLAARLEKSRSEREANAEEHNNAVRARQKHPSAFTRAKWWALFKNPEERKALQDRWYDCDGLVKPDLNW